MEIRIPANVFRDNEVDDIMGDPEDIIFDDTGYDRYVIIKMCSKRVIVDKKELLRVLKAYRED